MKENMERHATTVEQFSSRFESIEGVTAQFQAVVSEIKEIPWGKGRTCEEVLTKNVETCTGKHKLLEAVLKRLNIPHESVVCTFRWEEQGLTLPHHLQSILDEGSWEHGHNWVKITGLDKPFDIDLTWDNALAPYGFAVLPDNWNGNSSFIGLKKIDERWDGVSIDQMKARLIGGLTLEQQERRERFVDGLIEWSNELHSAIKA